MYQLSFRRYLKEMKTYWEKYIPKTEFFKASKLVLNSTFFVFNNKFRFNVKSYKLMKCCIKFNLLLLFQIWNTSLPCLIRKTFPIGCENGNNHTMSPYKFSSLFSHVISNGNTVASKISIAYWSTYNKFTLSWVLKKH